MTLEEIKKLAESYWEGCDGCDQNDKQMWINGFTIGYLLASESVIEANKEQRLTDYNVGYSDALCNHIRDGENYVNETSSKA